VNSSRFSPIKPLAVSLALALGILVADLTSRPLVPATNAQDSTDCYELSTVQDVPVGTSVPIADATLSGGVISARGVIVSGEDTDGVFGDDVRVVNGVIVSGEDVLADGTAVNNETTPCSLRGVIVSGEVLSSFGVIVSGEDSDVAEEEQSATASGTPTLEIVGGTVEGDNVRVENGVIRGDNLRVVGGYVTGSALRLSGASLSVQVAPVE
jgi:hypothetical protein